MSTAPLPGLELTTQALRQLVVDFGIVTAPIAAGGNALTDSTKSWGANVHRYRLLKVVSKQGTVQTALILNNSRSTLIISGAWAESISPGATYVIMGFDVAQAIRDTLGGGVNIDISAKIDEVIAALAIGLEASVDSGIATGGTNTTLVDANKNWELGMWENSLVEVQIAGTHYLRFTAAPFNTATVVTINALPVGVLVAAGCPYSIKRALNPLLPLDRALVHNAAVVGGADILGAVLAPTNTPCRFAVEVTFNAAGVFSVRTTNGGVTVGEDFNHGVALPINSLFRFSHMVHAGDTINYRYSVNATMLTMRVQEIIAAT